MSVGGMISCLMVCGHSDGSDVVCMVFLVQALGDVGGVLCMIMEGFRRSLFPCICVGVGFDGEELRLGLGSRSMRMGLLVA